MYCSTHIKGKDIDFGIFCHFKVYDFHTVLSLKRLIIFNVKCSFYELFPFILFMSAVRVLLYTDCYECNIHSITKLFCSSVRCIFISY